MRLRVLFLILLSVTVSVNLKAQKKNKKITISGYVTDADKKPVSGAIIRIDNEDSNIRTDYNGYYKIRIKSGTIMISVLSQDNQVRAELINGRTSIDFSLEKTDVSQENSQDKGETGKMIDLGYKKMDSKKISVPVNNLDVSGNEYSTYSNIYEMIKGKVPGVDVNGQSIHIQGINSFKGNNEPMFVVDGMPVNSIDYILPNTVQSISVLKGPATAIYGSRGVNGVIVISLKKNNVRRSGNK